MHEYFRHLDYLPHGYCILDQDMKVCYWNRSLELWSTLDRSMVEGVNIRVICPKLGNGSYKMRFENALKSRIPVVFSAQIHGHLIPCKGEDDKMQVHQTYVVPLDETYSAIVVENVTKNFNVLSRYRELVNKLSIAEQEAVQAEQTKSRFLANMSHEIRTPLNGIIGFCEDIVADDDLKEDHRNLLNMVIDCGKNLGVIINDVLDYSKLEASKVTLDPKPCSIHRCMEMIIEFHRKSNTNRDVTLEFNSSVDESVWLEIDDVRLSQVMGNLISNALKFTKSGLVTVTLSIEDTVSRRDLFLTVKDTGIGMTDEQVNRLFQPFEQADTSTTRNFGGTGLGLAIIKAFLDLMEAEVSVDSTPGKGTEFTLRMPCKESDVQAKTDSSNSISIASIAESREFSGIKILVAEDNLTNRMLIERQLQRLAVTCEFAVNGHEAVQFVKENSYDLVLMDCQMPIMDGYEATRAIRLLEINQPLIVALTANVLKEEVDLCHESGMDAVLSKPLPIKELAKFLQKLSHQNKKQAS